MPVWLTIVIAVAGCLVGIAGLVIGLLGWNAYSAERARHKAVKKNQKEDAEEQAEADKLAKLEAIEEKEFMDKIVLAVSQKILELLEPMINKALDNKLKPINDRLEQVQADVGLVKSGVQDTLRYDLEEMVDKADSQKYLPRYGKDQFDHMYKSYHSLGENGVMDNAHERVMRLPDSKPRKGSKK